MATALLSCALLVLALAAPVAAADTVDADPAVRDARKQVQVAREHLNRVTAELDAAAETYEHAQAHHVRLVGEASQQSEAVEASAFRTRTARSLLAEHVAAAYRNPVTPVAAVDVVLVAPDAATAIHRVELLGRVVAGAGREVVALGAVQSAVADTARQHAVVRAGTAAAAEDRRAAAEALSVAVRTAGTSVGDARVRLAAAEDDAARRIARREAAKAAAEAAEAAETGGVTGPGGATGIAGVAGGPVVTDGKACPVGAPNGFIDSWGFPRSGGRTHQGVDIFAEYGMPLYAVTAGTVKSSSNTLGGLVVYLTADNGDRYYYAHLSAIDVQDGQRVAAGDVVGAVGDSGNARGTPPHLHWQYHPGGGDAVNPYPLAAALCRPDGGS